MMSNNNSETSKSSRRNFFRKVGTGIAGVSMGTLVAPLTSSCTPGEKKEKDDGQILSIGDDIAVTGTSYGKVRGYKLRDIYYFLGIPYGADTSGVNRFMPAQKPKPWKDIYNAIWWGNSAPQSMDNRYGNPYASFRDHWNYDDVSEDCLRINVFTPALKDGKKRPVLLWLHGGGFVFGNAIEHDGYNGENFARFADTVFCSVNHRLGALGFTNLAAVGGGKYAASGNVGMLDIVTAMEWIRDNIENFGGDPGNITIMGQSGGGAKVTTLTAMPSAKGLFHKAVVLSGSSLKMGIREPSEKLGALVLKEAGLKSPEIGKLQELPWKDYIILADRALQKHREENPESRGMRSGFNPVVDGIILPRHPYYPEPSPLAADVPMLICSTFNEHTPAFWDPSLENVTLEKVIENLRDRAGFGPGYGEKAREVVQAYVNAYPGKKPVEIWSLVASNRQSAVALANEKARQPAPVYLAWFGWQPPMFNGRLGAFHCLDICFWFYNTDLMLSHTGGGSRPRNLAVKMAQSLMQFMKTGNPNGGGLPEWPAYSSGKGETMILDDICEVKDDPDREARKSLPAI
jgi:para-nitrobenzyl esterase